MTSGLRYCADTRQVPRLHAGHDGPTLPAAVLFGDSHSPVPHAAHTRDNRNAAEVRLSMLSSSVARRTAVRCATVGTRVLLRVAPWSRRVRTRRPGLSS